MIVSLEGLISDLYARHHTARQYITACRRRLFGPAFTTAPPPGREPGRILIVVKGLLGDSILCTPVLMEARRVWPSAAITVLGRPANCALLRGCPCIDSLQETMADPYTLRRGRELKELKAWLAREMFDLAVVALGDEFAVLVEQCGIPTRVGAAGTPLAPFLTHRFEIGGPATWGPDERLNSLRCLRQDVRYVQPRLWVTDQGRRSARDKLLRLGVPEGRPYAVIHPFSSSGVRSWPLQRAVELAGALLRRHGITTLLVGSRPVSVQTGSPIVNTTGLLSLPELLAVLEKAEPVVTTDSGPFHMAGALARPAVGLLRSMDPRYAHLYATSRVLLGADARCEHRCTWNGCRALPCRQTLSLDVDRVLQEVEILGWRGNHK